MGGRIVAENFSIAGIGYLRAEDRDAIPQAADFLLTEENVHTVIVYGIVTSSDLNTIVLHTPFSTLDEVNAIRLSDLELDPHSFRESRPR